MTFAALLIALLAAPTAGPGPQILDFHAEWCGPCREMRPRIELLVQKGYPVRSVDIDEDPKLAEQYQVSAVPTFVVVDGRGRQIARMEGAKPASELAALYNDARAKHDRRGPITPADKAPTRRASSTASPLPGPWETVVRIRIQQPGGKVGFGSGTIIDSDGEEAIVLTCAHIFQVEGRRQPGPKQFPYPITIDFFDGKALSGPKRNQVRYSGQSVAGKAIDYDFVTDVGLIRIRPGRPVPAARVVPAGWKPQVGMEMIAVGCSEGRDATACSTRISAVNFGGAAFGKPSYEGMQCDFRPSLGRSGGGLFTLDGHVAGVCDFAEVRSNHGLYATPRSIYRLLDRNNLAGLYAPPSNRPGALLASGRGASGRSEQPSKLRAQSHGEGDEIPMPAPEILNVKLPVEVSDPAPSVASQGRTAWRAASTAPRDKPSEGPSRVSQAETTALKTSRAEVADATAERPDTATGTLADAWRSVSARD